MKEPLRMVTAALFRTEAFLVLSNLSRDCKQMPAHPGWGSVFYQPPCGGRSPPGSGKHTFGARSHTGSRSEVPEMHWNVHIADIGSWKSLQGHSKERRYGAEPWLSQQDYRSSLSIFRPIADLLAPQEGPAGVWGSTMTQHSSLGWTGDSSSDSVIDADEVVTFQVQRQ